MDYIGSIICFDNISKSFVLFLGSLKKLKFLKSKHVSNSRLTNFISLLVYEKNLDKFLYSRALLNSKKFLKVNSSVFKFWFTELSLVGLGFRFSVKNKMFSFRLNIGFSHSVIIPILSKLFILKRKKRCLVFSSNLPLLHKFTSYVLHLKKRNCYKLKGLQLKNSIFRLKPGKRSK